jgi:hypothetical protein
MSVHDSRKTVEIFEENPHNSDNMITKEEENGGEWTCDIRDCYHPTSTVSKIIKDLIACEELEKEMKLESDRKIYERVRQLYDKRDLVEYHLSQEIFMEEVEQQLQCEVSDLESWIDKYESMIVNSIVNATKGACTGIKPLTEYFRILEKP